jgi:hypothetical protein
MIPFSRNHRSLGDILTRTDVVAGAVAARTRED